MKGTLWCGVLLGAAACVSPLSNNEFLALAEGEHRWATRGFTYYSIETKSSCFCPPELNEWARIEVLEGEVLRVTILSTGAVIDDSRVSSWSSVEDLFDEIHRANRNSGLADVKFTLDPTLGFPTFVRWRYDDNIVDAGGTRSLRNAEAMPVP